MADDADLAADRAAMEVAAQLTRVDATIPAGVPGECDDCGDIMPRLVGGRCGFCRDGRRPPVAAYDRAAAQVAAAPSRTIIKPEEPPMSSKLTATLNLTGDLADAFRTFAADRSMSQGAAVAHLVAQALADGGDDQEAAQSDDALTSASVDELLDELAGRYEQAGRAADLERDLGEANDRVKAAEERADKAAAQLAMIGGVLSGHVQPADAQG